MREFNRALLEELFRRAELHLKKQGIVGEILLFGGSAMIFAFSERTHTKDIDAYFVPKEEVKSALLAAAHELGISPEKEDWLSSAVLRYIYGRPPKKLETIYDGTHLRVFVPSKDYLLAMKLFAARDEKDFEDAVKLAEMLGLKTEKELIEVFKKVFPEYYLEERRKGFLKEVADALQEKRRIIITNDSSPRSTS